MPVHAALHLVAVYVRPHLIYTFKKWYAEKKLLLKPCSAPSECSSRSSSNFREGLCRNCVHWINVLEDACDHSEEKVSLSLENIDFSNLYNDPVEVVKAFVPDLPLVNLDIDSLDTKSTWFLMGKFTPFHKENNAITEAVQNVSIMSRLSKKS